MQLRLLPRQIFGLKVELDRWEHIGRDVHLFFLNRAKEKEWSTSRLPQVSVVQTQADVPGIDEQPCACLAPAVNVRHASR